MSLIITDGLIILKNIIDYLTNLDIKSKINTITSYDIPGGCQGCPVVCEMNGDREKLDRHKRVTEVAVTSHGPSHVLREPRG